MSDVPLKTLLTGRNMEVMQKINDVVNRLCKQEGEVTILSVAMELLSTESASFALFMRLGDRDEHPPGSPHAYAIAGEGMDEPKLVKTIGEWVDEMRKLL